MIINKNNNLLSKAGKHLLTLTILFFILFLVQYPAYSAEETISWPSDSQEAQKMPAINRENVAAEIDSADYDHSSQKIGKFEIGSDVVVQKNEISFGAVSVGGDVLVYGDARDGAVAIGGDTLIEGMANDAVAIGGTVKISGQVSGDVVAVGGSVVLGPGVIVNGDVVAIGGQIEKAPDAKILGEQVNVGLGANFPEGLLPLLVGLKLIVTIISVIILGGLIVLTIALFPGNSGFVAKSIENNSLRVFLIGFLAAILMLPTSLLLMITIVGIPFLMLLWLLAAIAVIVGISGFSLWLGQKVIGRFRPEPVNDILSALLGVIIIILLWQIPVIGWLIILFIKIFALGLALDTKFGFGTPWFGSKEIN